MILDEFEGNANISVAIKSGCTVRHFEQWIQEFKSRGFYVEGRELFKVINHALTIWLWMYWHQCSAIHRYYISATHILYQYYRDTISVLHRYYISTTEILYQYYTDTISVLHRYYISTTQILYQYYTDTISVLHRAATSYQCTHLVSKGVKDVDGVEHGDKSEGGQYRPLLLELGDDKTPVYEHPANQAGPQLKEELEVEMLSARVQLATHPEIVEEITCKGTRTTLYTTSEIKGEWEAGLDWRTGTFCGELIGRLAQRPHIHPDSE